MKKLFLSLLLSSAALAEQPTITFTVSSACTSTVIKAYVNEEPAGSLHFHIMSENPCRIYIDKFYVNPSFRNQKIGTALMQEALRIFEHDEHAAEIFLQACPFGEGPKLDLPTLMGFYNKFGFVFIADPNSMETTVANADYNDWSFRLANMRKKTMYYQEA